MKNIKKQSRVAMRSTELPEDIIEQIRNTRMSDKYNHLNELLDKDEMNSLTKIYDADDKS